MSNFDPYDIVRQKLAVGPLHPVRHALVTDLLKVFWDEETAKILAHFPSAGERIQLDDLVSQTGLEKKQIRKLLDVAVKRRTLNKHVAKGYCLEPILPGVFEAYFIARQDTPENLQKAAKLFWQIFNTKEVMGSNIDENFTLFRPVLPSGATEKLIQVDQSIDAESQVLPYELVEDLVNKNDHFTAIPCQCRLIGEMNGEPCKRTTPEIGCLATGPAAVMLAETGMGKAMSKEETLAYLKKAEKAGLVHSTSNSTGGEHLLFICNCCPCHCGVLKSVSHYKTKTLCPSNFQPKLDSETCTECETCVKKCPMGAITLPDGGTITINYDLCLGCGVCAYNCPSGALKLVKVRNVVPPVKNLIGNKIFMRTLGELLGS